MPHKSYGKVYHIDKEECEGILNGVCYIQEKIDGANLSVWKEEDEIFVGSRTQTVGTDKIKNGFRGAVEYINNHKGINNLFLELQLEYETADIRLYGEWLVPHTITNYNKESYNHFYLFDIEINGERLEINSVNELADKNGILRPKLFIQITNPKIEQINQYIGQSDIGPNGEGIVIKNPKFVNKFGNAVYGKLVTETFKESNKLTFSTTDKRDTEIDITGKYCDWERIRKIMNKIEQNDGEDIQKKHIAKILGLTWYDIITEEANAISKYGVVDFNRLKGLVEKKTKMLVLNHFNGGEISVAFDKTQNLINNG